MIGWSDRGAYTDSSATPWLEQPCGARRKKLFAAGRNFREDLSVLKRPLTKGKGAGS